MKMKKIQILYTLIIASMLFVSACNKKTEASANMEQIYKEKGIPIKTELIKKSEFSNDLMFNATINCLQETSVSSMLSDQVEKIHVKIGDQVKKDQIIIEFPTDNPSASYHQAEAGYQLASQTYQRMKVLYDNGGLSKQELDGVETQYKVSRANWDAVQQAVKVRAPISGIVTDINVYQNEKTKSGDLLCTIGQIATMRTRIWVTENEVTYLKKGMQIEYKWNEEFYKGRITDIALSKNIDKQAFGIDIEILNKNNQLKSGVNGQIIIPTQKISNTLLIDRKYIQTDENNKDYVFVAVGDKAEKKFIERGVQNNLQVQVKSGLSENDLIITEGYNLVDNGSKIMIVKE